MTIHKFWSFHQNIIHSENDFFLANSIEKKEEKGRKYILAFFQTKRRTKKYVGVEQSAYNWIIYNEMHLLLNMIIALE